MATNDYVSTHQKSALTEQEARLNAGNTSRTKWYLMERAGETPPCIRLGKKKIYPTKEYNEWLHKLLNTQNGGNHA